MTISLANRLSVYALRDLSSHPPLDLNAAKTWLDHCGFWLADLATHPRTPDQLPFMIGLLAMAMRTHLPKWPQQEACNTITEYLRLHQLTKELKS